MRYRFIKEESGSGTSFKRLNNNSCKASHKPATHVALTQAAIYGLREFLRCCNTSTARVFCVPLQIPQSSMQAAQPVRVCAMRYAQTLCDHSSSCKQHAMPHASIHTALCANLMLRDASFHASSHASAGPQPPSPVSPRISWLSHSLQDGHDDCGVPPIAFGLPPVA